MTCIFCNLIKPQQVLRQTEYFKVINDSNPIQKGHLLILSKKHYESLTELPLPALHDLIELEAHLVALLEKYLPIDGVTCASNDNKLMDTGTHFHCHLIPRVKNDGFWDKIDLPPLDYSLQSVDKVLRNGQ